MCSVYAILLLVGACYRSDSNRVGSILKLINGEEDISTRVKDIDAEAFGNNYLIGFHLETVTFKEDMVYTGPTLTTRDTSDLNQPKWRILKVGQLSFYAGQASKVARPEIVPKATALDEENTRTQRVNVSIEKDKTPAAYFAYVKFATTMDGKDVKTLRVAGLNYEGNPFRFGGFVYFASKAHLEKGVPMQTLNILSKSDSGTMRFKEGFSTFWQIEVSGKKIDFPPDSSKEITWYVESLVRDDKKMDTFNLKIPMRITYPWFGVPYDGPPPATEGATCFILNSKKSGAWRGTCSFEAHTQFNLPITIKPLSEVLPAAGVPGAEDSIWWTITREDFIEAGATHYTWVQPGELGEGGGFIYYMKGKGTGGADALTYFEMLSSLCTAENSRHTVYDAWKEEFVKGERYNKVMKPAVQTVAATEFLKTVVFVIDMQNDNVDMNNQQPCKPKRDDLLKDLTKFIEAQYKQQATIFASLDYHPKDHCGLSHSCENGPGLFMDYEDFEDEELNSMQDDLSYYQGDDKTTGRYLNRFPPHCEYFFSAGADKRSVPSEGAKFHKDISSLLHKLVEMDTARKRVHTVFKGFSPRKDSFSALPTYEGDEQEEFTGGFALSSNPRVYTPWPQFCYETLENPDPPRTCFPTQDQLEHPTRGGNSMWRISDVLSNLQQDGEFDRVIVTGLVFDFNVKETAFNALELFPGKQVIVPLELARPACEGGHVPKVAYKPDGLGTEDIIARTEKEYAARGIQLAKMCDIDPSLCP